MKHARDIAMLLLALLVSAGMVYLLSLAGEPQSVWIVSLITRAQ